MDPKEANEKRLLAAQILTELYEAKELGQIQLLFMQSLLSFKSLDPALYQRYLQDNGYAKK